MNRISVSLIAATFLLFTGLVRADDAVVGVGSIGLLLVAPFTALVGSIILPAKSSRRL